MKKKHAAVLVIATLACGFIAAIGLTLKHDGSRPAPTPAAPSDKATCEAQLDAAMARWQSQIDAYGYYSAAADQKGQGLIPVCGGLTPEDRTDVYNDVHGKWGDQYQIAVWQGLNG